MPLEKVSQIDQTKPIRNELPLSYLYTAGIAGERFFREIKDNGKLFATKCPKCNLVYLPPSLFCERCFSQMEDWLVVKHQGTVHTYTISYIDLDGAKLDKPVILAFVQFDGIHGGLVHFLDEIKPEKVKIGIPVEAVFKPKAERTGSILDIKYFKPC